MWHRLIWIISAHTGQHQNSIFISSVLFQVFGAETNTSSDLTDICTCVVQNITFQKTRTYLRWSDQELSFGVDRFCAVKCPDEQENHCWVVRAVVVSIVEESTYSLMKPNCHWHLKCSCLRLRLNPRYFVISSAWLLTRNARKFAHQIMTKKFAVLWTQKEFFQSMNMQLCQKRGQWVPKQDPPITGYHCLVVVLQLCSSL